MREGWIIVTGGSRGIGEAIVRELVRKGCRVASLSRSGEAPAGEGFVCDITDEAAIERTFEAIAARGPIVGLVNNAGMHTNGPSATLPTSAFEEMLRVNTLSAFVASRTAHRHLVAAGGGSIVNIGSFFDKLGTPHNVAYSASKAAVGAMTRCLAVEWARDHIKVINVAPGYIETDLNRDFLASEKTQAWLRQRVPMRRAGHADEVDRMVATLFEADIDFLTGETIYLDGGQGMAH